MIEQIMAYNAFDSYNYNIPIFQRGYAWGKDEIECLLEDILNSQGDYFIGTVTVEEKENCLLLIDGQQRLTTLYLILCLICDNKSILENKLRFEARNNAQGILESLSSSSAIKTCEEKESSLLYGIEIINAWFENNKINKNPILQTGGKLCLLELEQNIGYNPS